MPQAQGSSAQIGIQQETTFKQLPTTPDLRLLYFKSESLRSTRNLVTTETIRGNRNPVKPALGHVAVEGDITMELSAFMGIIFKAALGSSNTTGTGPYTHTFTIGGSLPSYTIEKGFKDIGVYHLYNGCKVNSLKINIVPEGFQEVTVNFMGALETVGTSSFDPTMTDLTFVPFDGFSIATIEEGGATIAYVTAIDGLTISNNLDGNSYVIGGQGVRRYIPEGNVVISGTLRALFESSSLYQKALNSTETSLKIVYKFGTGNGSAGNESLEIYIPELIYQPQAPVISGGGGVVVELPFNAYYDNDSGASAIKITLKNSSATL